MGRETEKFTIEAEAKGFNKAAADIQKVDAAQEKLSDATTKGAKPAEDLSQAQTKLNASTETYTSLLSRINPALGAVFDSLVKGSQVIGDFAGKQLHLTGIMHKATVAIRANWNALKLFAAGGVLAAGIYAIVRAVNALRDAHERAEKAAKAQLDAITALDKQAAESAARVAASQAKEQYRLPFTVAQVESVRQTRMAAPEDIRDKMEPILQALGGARGFGEGAGEFAGGQLEMLTRLGYTPQADVPMEVNVNTARAFLARRADAAQQMREQLKGVGEQAESRAAQQAVTGGAGQQGLADLDKIIAEEARAYGLTPEEFAPKFIEQAARGRRITAERQRARESGGWFPGYGRSLESLAAGGEEYGPLGQPSLQPGSYGQFGMYGSAQEAMAAKQIEQRLAPHVTNIDARQYHHNGRYFGNDSAAQRGRVTNGESLGRMFE